MVLGGISSGMICDFGNHVAKSFWLAGSPSRPAGHESISQMYEIRNHIIFLVFPINTKYVNTYFVLLILHDTHLIATISEFAGEALQRRGS